MFLIRREDARLIGAITLDSIRRGPAQSAQVGYWVGPDFARQGYMTEALAAVTTTRFDALDLSRIEAACLPENLASRGLLEKTGFDYEGSGARLSADQWPLARPRALCQPAPATGAAPMCPIRRYEGTGLSAPLASADAAVLERLSAALGPEGAIPPEPRYLEEPRGRYHGQAAAVLRPASVAEVQAVVRICAAARVGIVPYSGGTGLVGGQIMTDGPLPVLLSLERLRRDPRPRPDRQCAGRRGGRRAGRCSGGGAAADRLFPLSLASEGSARIGGLLGTNAGGINVLRYGNARDLCLGIEAVLADGSLLHGLSRLHKNNMGYDLRHLLIGSEGTLGIITAASLRLYPHPEEPPTAWIAMDSPAAALDLLSGLRDAAGRHDPRVRVDPPPGLRFPGRGAAGDSGPDRRRRRVVVLAEVADGPGSEIGRAIRGGAGRGAGARPGARRADRPEPAAARRSSGRCARPSPRRTG